MRRKRNKSRRLAILRAKIRGREKGCSFCKLKITPRWEDSEKLGEYLSARSRIIHRQFSGVCVSHQKKLAKAIKQARHLGLLPFVTR